MEEENKVSIWLGNFNSEDELTEYMEEHFTEDGDMYSDFMKAFEIDFIDNQFQEVFFSKNLSKEDFKSFSYAESYVDDINANLENYNSVIAIYNFNYSKKIQKSSDVDFIGVYDYQWDNFYKHSM